MSTLLGSFQDLTFPLDDSCHTSDTLGIICNRYLYLFNICIFHIIPIISSLQN